MREGIICGNVCSHKRLEKRFKKDTRITYIRKEREKIFKLIGTKGTIGKDTD